jgi:hypothetical protein
MFLLDAYSQNLAFWIIINKIENLHILRSTSLCESPSHQCVYPFDEVSIEVPSPQAIDRDYL